MAHCFFIIKSTLKHRLKELTSAQPRKIRSPATAKRLKFSDDVHEETSEKEISVETFLTFIPTYLFLIKKFPDNKLSRVF